MPSQHHAGKCPARSENSSQSEDRSTRWWLCPTCCSRKSSQGMGSNLTKPSYCLFHRSKRRTPYVSTLPGGIWHCIDPNGFNNGRNNLTRVFNAAAKKKGSGFTILRAQRAQLYRSGVGTDAGAGSSVDHIPYDGKVDILVLRFVVVLFGYLAPFLTLGVFTRATTPS